MRHPRAVSSPGIAIAALVAALLASGPMAAAVDPLLQEIDKRAAAVNSRVVEWRRDIHQNPELSNREFRTSKLVAEHLTKLGLEVKKDVAHTGVIGLLRGSAAAPVVALRADMDALPVTEEADVPFASKARDTYNGREVGVMHACGHDGHVAILMGVAEVLAGVREKIPGTVKLIFQPAEEGPPEGEEGGASLMVKQGALENPKPAAIFGLHVSPLFDVGWLATRPGGALAASDTLRILVTGRQVHASRPWDGVDPIVAASQIVVGLQTIASRQIDVSLAPAVVTIGIIQGGVRSNIIPQQVEMVGTIRTLDAAMRSDIHARIKRTAEMIAESAGAKAEVRITLGTPITSNDPELMRRMAPTLQRVAGADKVELQMIPWLGAEDFAYYQEVIPGLYFVLGVRTPGATPDQFPYNHTPRFRLDEDALALGVRALSHLAVDSLRMTARGSARPQ